MIMYGTLHLQVCKCVLVVRIIQSLSGYIVRRVEPLFIRKCVLTEIFIVVFTITSFLSGNDLRAT